MRLTLPDGYVIEIDSIDEKALSAIQDKYRVVETKTYTDEQGIIRTQEIESVSDKLAMSNEIRLLCGKVV